MSDVPLADTCACGSSHWHRPAEPADGPIPAPSSSSGSINAARPFLWCRNCGSIRFLFDTHWQIPLRLAGEIARSVPLEDERPTDPGTPDAKKKDPH